MSENWMDWAAGRITQLETALESVREFPERWIEIYGYDKFDVADWLREEIKALDNLPKI